MVAAASARADGDAPNLVRVQLASSAQPYAIEAAACALPGIRVGARRLDVRIGDRRCSTAPVPDDAIAFVVRIEPGLVTAAVGAIGSGCSACRSGSSATRRSFA